jgi:hypothetical protein
MQRSAGMIRYNGPHSITVKIVLVAPLLVNTVRFLPHLPQQIPVSLQVLETHPWSAMLQIHPDSTCDVCLDHYSFTNNAKTPHAIPCGHIFCYEYVGGNSCLTGTDCAYFLRCLSQLNHPPSCPLCRETFSAVHHIKKLHVDRPVLGERETAMPDAWRFLERLSRCARSDVDIPTTETDELIGEAQRWLETGNHKELVRPPLPIDMIYDCLTLPCSFLRWTPRFRL